VFQIAIVLIRNPDPTFCLDAHPDPVLYPYYFLKRITKERQIIFSEDFYVFNVLIHFQNSKNQCGSGSETLEKDVFLQFFLSLQKTTLHYLALGSVLDTYLLKAVRYLLVICNL